MTRIICVDLIWSYLYNTRALEKVISNKRYQKQINNSLAPLAKKITKLHFTAKLLLSLIEQDQDTQRDIGAMSLKILINEIPESHPELSQVLKVLVPGLLKVVESCQAVDVVEVLRDLVARFGTVFSGFAEGVGCVAIARGDCIKI